VNSISVTALFPWNAKLKRDVTIVISPNGMIPDFSSSLPTELTLAPVST
jgi:hypothetical protein